jgi:hypothetical protein
MEINRYHLYLSSSKRQSGSLEDYYIALKRPIILKNPHHYFKVVIKEATIPYTFQQVNANYCRFKYCLQHNGFLHPDRTISLSFGNYTILTLLKELSSKLAQDISSYVAGYSPTFNFTYDRNSMFCTFALVNDGASSNTITILPLAEQISTMLGVVTQCSFGNAGATLFQCSSTQPVNVSPITSIFIRSETLKQSNLSTENIVTRDDTSDILLQIPILNQPTAWIQYQNELNIENQVVNAIINDVNLYLSDNRSYSLDLRGIDWSCMLTIIEYQGAEETHFTENRNIFRGDLQPINDILSEGLQLKSGIPVLIPPQKEIQ